MTSRVSRRYQVIERRLRRDRRLGLQRRIGMYRDHGLGVSMERRGIARAMETSERRTRDDRRFHGGLLASGIGSLLTLERWRDPGPLANRTMCR